MILVPGGRPSTLVVLGLQSWILSPLVVNALGLGVLLSMLVRGLSVLVFGFAFLYIQILSLIVYSFNKSRLVTV